MTQVAKLVVCSSLSFQVNHLEKKRSFSWWPLFKYKERKVPVRLLTFSNMLSWCTSWGGNPGAIDKLFMGAIQSIVLDFPRQPAILSTFFYSITPFLTFSGS
jgi:hypothetical protein